MKLGQAWPPFPRGLQNLKYVLKSLDTASEDTVGDTSNLESNRNDITEI